MQMSPQSVALDEIVAFTTAARRQSFVGAAKELGLDPSLLSRRIRRLEEALGVRLFVRTTRKISLTEAGERYLSRVSDVLEQLEAAGLEAAELAAQPQGVLRVSLPISFGQMVVAPMLSGFVETHPRIRLDLSFTNRRVDLVAEGYDLAIRMGDPRDSSLSMRRIGSYQDILVAAPAYLSGMGEPQTPADLSHHGCLSFTGNAHWPDWHLSDGSTTVRLRPEGPITADSSEVLITAAVDGCGIVLTPDWMAVKALNAGHLVRVLPQWQGVSAGLIQALLPPGRMLPAKTRVFLDYVASALRGRSLQ
ncbi:LysR family transcriptional regulator [Paracoccus rhizosphaerae]|uniref:LysR family transcriptional regulator n=1 Tax=Paracoccus rhizosphaerae TaxID=1133347 RepID=A0ABV6CHY1_9RHOB|nr:LysR family transcriptional regulator [Paracoccus rhizosphaerae]